MSTAGVRTARYRPQLEQSDGGHERNQGQHQIDRGLGEGPQRDQQRFECRDAQALAYFTRRVGAEAARPLQVGSPYDYARQMKAYIPARIPDPRDSGYEEALIHWIERFVRETHGKAFVLFTNARLMHDIAERMTGFFEELGLECFVQGSGMPRSLAVTPGP